jgi:hypothetical protein
MLSYQPLPGSLSGQLDGVSFSYYWNAIKDHIQDLYNLGYKISLYQQRMSTNYSTLMAKGKTNEAEVMKQEVLKAQDDLQKWWKVKALMDKWLPKFMQASQQSVAEQQSTTLGILPLVILGVAGIAALTTSVTVGMALHQDYKFKMGLTQQVADGKITPEQEATILSSTGGGILGKFSLGLGIGISTMALIGVGGYLLYTGALGKMLGGSQQHS